MAASDTWTHNAKSNCHATDRGQTNSQRYLIPAAENHTSPLVIRKRLMADTVVMCVVTGNSDDEYVARPQAGGRQSSNASSTLHSLLDSVINK